MAGGKERIGGLNERDPRKHKIVEFLMEHATIELNLNGEENLEIFRELKRQGKKLGVIPNHRSNADAGVIEHVLEKNGYSDIAEDIVYMLGMKLKLKKGTTFLAEAFNHIDVSPMDLKDLPEYAVQSRRINREAFEATRKVMGDGKAILIFGEGTRTRTGELAPFIPEVAHYFKEPDTYVMPIAVYGTETIWPVDKRFLNLRNRGSASVTFGEPVEAKQFMVGEGRMRYENFASSMRDMVEALIPEDYRLPYQ